MDRHHHSLGATRSQERVPTMDYRALQGIEPLLDFFLLCHPFHCNIIARRKQLVKHGGGVRSLQLYLLRTLDITLRTNTSSVLSQVNFAVAERQVKRCHVSSHSLRPLCMSNINDSYVRFYRSRRHNTNFTHETSVTSLCRTPLFRRCVDRTKSFAGTEPVVAG